MEALGRFLSISEVESNGKPTQAMDDTSITIDTVRNPFDISLSSCHGLLIRRFVVEF